MFGYQLVKTEAKPEKGSDDIVIDKIIALTPLLHVDCSTSNEVKSIVNEKLRDLIKLL